MCHITFAATWADMPNSIVCNESICTQLKVKPMQNTNNAGMAKPPVRKKRMRSAWVHNVPLQGASGRTLLHSKRGFEFDARQKGQQLSASIHFGKWTSLQRNSRSPRHWHKASLKSPQSGRQVAPPIGTPHQSTVSVSPLRHWFKDQENASISLSSVFGSMSLLRITVNKNLESSVAAYA